MKNKHYKLPTTSGCFKEKRIKWSAIIKINPQEVNLYKYVMRSCAEKSLYSEKSEQCIYDDPRQHEI